MAHDDKRRPLTRIVSRSEERVPLPQLGGKDVGDLHATLGRSIRSIRERKLAGTKKLTFGDLLVPDSGLIVRTKAKRISPAGGDIPDIVEWLNTIIRPASIKKALVLAAPGEGKTTASLLLFNQMANAYLQSADAMLFPMLLDLRNQRNAINTPDYGTVEWLTRFVEAHYGNAVKSLCCESPAISSPLCIILDSLDEVLAGRSFAEVRSALERYVFTESAVVLCRSHFYEQYLQYLPFAMDREIVSLLCWDSEDVCAYIKAFYRRACLDNHIGSSNAFIEWMQTSSSLPSILRVPIRLNMALDMYSPEGEVFPRHRTLLQLYEAYISWSINLERSRTNAMLEDTYRLLEDIAWETYGERDALSSKASGTTERSLFTFFADRSPNATSEQIETELSYVLNLGLLAMSDDAPPGRDHTIDFVHKSFQECLVATRMAGVMTSSSQKSAEMCESYLTPEVSEFLKEAIERLNTHPRQVSKAVTILIDAIRKATKTNVQNAEAPKSGRKRLMVEQLCYYLGNLESRTAQQFLLKLIENETDEWIRRGIAVGLAFGGHYEPLHKYLDELRSERNIGSHTPKSDANIGFHLSFFGDQPFDPECPDRDMGFEECGKTVARLIYQLGTDTNRPNWRIDLYTLLDLRHRAISERSYWPMMKANLMNLNRIYVRFMAHEKAKVWPETLALGELLNDPRLRTGEQP